MVNVDLYSAIVTKVSNARQVVRKFLFATCTLLMHLIIFSTLLFSV